MNFGDGTVDSMNVSGTGTFSFDTTHQYTSNGLFVPTLTLVGNDGATSLIKAAASPTLLISSPPPQITSFTINTTTSLVTAVFSEDVGAALVSTTTTDGNYTPLGEPLWTDGAVAAGVFGDALDIRNDNSNASFLTATQLASAFSYNATNFTAAWNLSGLLNTTSTSYTARLFAAEIQDQAGNDLDGIGSGYGGTDATAHFGASAPVNNVTLATGGVWNTAMPLIFAPTIAPNSIQSITTVNALGTPSTQITFTSNAANRAILDNLNKGDPVIITDMAAGFTALDGLWDIDKNANTGAATLTIPYGTALGTWAPGSAGTLHVAVPGEATLVTALEQMTGQTSIPMTSKVVYGIDVGTAPQFDTNTVTDPTGYNKSFDNETQLISQDGYVVRTSSSANLELIGGSAGGENDAIDAFLQSLGFEIYGPANVASSTNPNVWQITPNFTSATLSGSWDINSATTIGYIYDSGGSGGWTGNDKAGWDPFYEFDYGGGEPNPNIIQAGNLGIPSDVTHLDAHPDWWASGNGSTLVNSKGYVSTFMPLGTINVGDTFSITLSTGGTSETLTITANSSDNTPSGIVGALVTAITGSSLSYFESTNITAVTNSDYDTDGPLTSASTTNPVVEIYLAPTAAFEYGVSSSTSGLSDSFLADVYHTSQLNFANPGTMNYVVNNYVTGLLSGLTPGSMLSLSAQDGGGYDNSISTIDTMHANYPFIGKASDTFGYNQNGVLVDAVSESYWAVVDAGAKVVMAYTANQISSGSWQAGSVVYIGALEYASTGQPPSFKMSSNVYMEVSEIYDYSPESKDQQLKTDKQLGAQTGVYDNWGIYFSTGYDNPTPAELVPSGVLSRMTMFNDDHVLALEGENAPTYTGEMPGYLMTGLLADSASYANTNILQTALTTYYNDSFGPGAVGMEDYFVLFNGTSADPNLSSTTLGQSWSGHAWGNATQVDLDEAILQYAFSDVDAADTALTNAYNSGHNASFTKAQHDADQARVDQDPPL